MNRGKYAHMGLCVKYALRKSSGVSKIPPAKQNTRRTTVSVFVSTLQLTALLWKSFLLRLHCYTLTSSVERKDLLLIFFFHQLQIQSATHEGEDGVCVRPVVRLQLD
jgi:hypothetical protein